MQKYYDKLIMAADKKDKSEVEVYQKVSNCVNEILDSETTRDNYLVIKALIAYFEGKSSKSWFMSVISIAYALMIGGASLLSSTDIANRYLIMIVIVILACADLIIIVAVSGYDFEKKIVLCVLNDKLDELDMKLKSEKISSVIVVKDRRRNVKRRNTKRIVR